MSADEPAFPASTETGFGMTGLTKREHFSLEMAKAYRIAHPNASPPEVANMGVVDGDALLDLLAQLAKEPT